MDGNVPCFNLFSEVNQDWHLEDLDLIRTQQLSYIYFICVPRKDAFFP